MQLENLENKIYTLMGVKTLTLSEMVRGLSEMVRGFMRW